MINNKFAPPLTPQPPNLGDPHIRKAISVEAERQIEIFKDGNGTTKKFIVRNIATMCRMGCARVEGVFGDYEVVFWDPWKHYYHELDEELNTNMLGLMGNFKII